eukprot:387976_1
MCFTQLQSLALCISGIITIFLVRRTWSTGKDDEHHSRFICTIQISYFIAMEFLQFLMYFVVADSLEDDRCNNIFNKFFTILGWIHICFQPVFCSIHMLGKGVNTPITDEQRLIFKYLTRLAFIGGIYLLIPNIIYHWDPVYINKISYPKTDWIRGDIICTFKTSDMIHFGWSLPRYTVHYFVGNGGLHFFLMFGPYFIFGKERIIAGLMLIILGPVLSMYITDNVYSQPAIWCFLSILQVILAVGPRLYKYYIKGELLFNDINIQMKPAEKNR